ncbi:MULTISPECIES: CopM family metallochaperone [unclassified Psychrobacter]|uniref:CopM family metallochaperone n=1 Tax=unclassified Psychrobacter TaxID=196806 RepID=UPI003FD0123C
MIASRRFLSLVTSISAALLLSACQPTTEDNQSNPVEETSPPVTDMPHAEHDGMADDTLTNDSDNNVIDESQMSDMLRDYTRSMTRMHDEMMIGMGYNDPDTAFAKGMLGHHRGAVEMAKIELKYGTDEAMRQLAQDVITAQQAEIDVLNKWLASHPDAAKPKPNTVAMQQAYAKSMQNMHGEMTLGVADPAPDMAFARGMLPHHIAAVDMAKVQLEYGTDEEMRQLAQDVIDNQQTEIDVMKNWIAALEAASSNEDDSSVDENIEPETTDNKNSDNPDNRAKEQ